MKVRIIKRMDREKAATEIPSAKGRSKSVGAHATMTATVNSWIDELRRKRDDEQRLVQQLFKAENFG